MKRKIAWFVGMVLLFSVLYSMGESDTFEWILFILGFLLLPLGITRKAEPKPSKKDKRKQ